MSAAIEELMLDRKGLIPNVDFYSATVYYSMGIPIDLFTPVFAASRVVRLVRPRSRAVREQPDLPAARPLRRSARPALRRARIALADTPAEAIGRGRAVSPCHRMYYNV